MEALTQPVLQKISYARACLWAPFYTVGMVIRVRGKIAEKDLRFALQKLQVLYPSLASRVIVNRDASACLTTKNVADLTFDVFPWSSEDQWAEVFLHNEKIPFSFEQGPIARFILLQGEQYSDVIAIVPHVICDGYSMSQVMIDLLRLLNHPEHEVIQPPPAPPVCWDNVYHSPLNNLLLRGLARLINFTWNNGHRVVQQDYYEECHKQYWQAQNNRVSITHFSPEETSTLVKKSRQHKTSVTAVLVAAFIKARLEQQPGIVKAPCEISIAVNIRDKLINPPGRAFGVYASSFDEKVIINPQRTFWEMARDNYLSIQRAIHNPELMLRPLVLDELDPRIIDSLLLDGLCSGTWNSKSRLLTRFIKIKGNARCLDVSNIGRIEVTGQMPLYPFEALMPFPPLVPGDGMAVNVITVNGAMKIILKYNENEMNEETVVKVKNRVLDLLMGE